MEWREKKNSLQEIIYSFFENSPAYIEWGSCRRPSHVLYAVVGIAERNYYVVFYISYSGTICAAIVKILYLRFKSFFLVG